MPSKPKKNKKKTKNGMSLRQSTTKTQKQIHLTTLATRNKSWGLGKHTFKKNRISVVFTIGMQNVTNV